ncbi:MAG: hypothetical protein HZB83_05475 [Deltaproteobacteria bacterium]|nr:hypothetical protein [Deltaproteobacteria bacterium]
MTQVDEQKTEKSGVSSGRPEAEPQKVVFQPDQQTKVQELIDDAYRKAYAKALKSRSSSEEVDMLRAEVDSLKQERKNALLYRAISRYNVVDAEEVAKLCGERVSMDERGFAVVVNAAGAVEINAAGHPVALDEYIAQWLSERPHHLRASGAAGAGSGSARYGGLGAGRHDINDPSAWRGMPREELDRYLRDGIDIQGSAGQVYRFKDHKNPFLDARRRRFGAAQPNR